jgi:hypothetical protein
MAGDGSQKSVAEAVPVLAGKLLAVHSIVIFAGQMIWGDTTSLMITSWLHTLVHPFPSVTVTEYVPAALTVIQLMVAPVLQA